MRRCLALGPVAGLDVPADGLVEEHRVGVPEDEEVPRQHSPAVHEEVQRQEAGLQGRVREVQRPARLRSGDGVGLVAESPFGAVGLEDSLYASG